MEDRNFLSRRLLLKAGAAGALAAAMPRLASANSDGSFGTPVEPGAPVEYIVVGSGAGGGPLACNLARAGHKVVLFEAGGGQADDIAAVPFFTGATTEDERIRWDYYVRHYGSDTQQRRDPKFLPDKGGVWYPRVGALGGCTVHSRMIAIYPDDSDWHYIRRLTGDNSWHPGKMRATLRRRNSPSRSEQKPQDFIGRMRATPVIRPMQAGRTDLCGGLRSANPAYVFNT